MLQQQNFLDKDSETIVAMIARDDSGKGDWGVHRALSRKWKDRGASSEEKWAHFEGEIKRLGEGEEEGKRKWAVSVIGEFGESQLNCGHTGGFAVLC